MRRSIRGAAAIAALCTGALAFSPVAIADPGSGNLPESARIAGVDRVQTSLEALNRFSYFDSVVVVGYNGVVDALSVATLRSPVVYASPDGLDSRVLASLKARARNLTDIVIAGGYGVVPAKVESQLAEAFAQEEEVGLIRIDGKDRYETSYLAGALAKAHDNALRNSLREVTSMKHAKSQLAALEAAYKKNRETMLQAERKVEDLQKKVDELNAKLIDDLSRIGNPDVDAATEAFKTAKAESDADVAAVADLKKAVPARDLLFKLYGNTSEMTLEAVKNAADLVISDPTKYTDADKTSAIATLEAVKNLKAAGYLDSTKVVELKDLDNQISKAQEDAKASVALTAKAKAAAIAAAEKAAELNGTTGDFANHSKELDKALGELDKAKNELTDAQDFYGQSQEAYMQAKIASDELLNKDMEKLVWDKAKAVYDEGDFPIFLTTGKNFSDALTSGPAAVNEDGVVLLTLDSEMTPYVADAVAKSGMTTYAIGGPAAAAKVETVKVVGSDRYDTSAKVAVKFFKAEAGDYALASGQTGADAVVAGAFMAGRNCGQLRERSMVVASCGGKAVLLTMKNQLPTSVEDFLSYGDHGENQAPLGDEDELHVLYTFGGAGAISDAVVGAALSAAVK